MPSSARPCRSSARSSAKLLIFGRARKCSMWPPATATLSLAAARRWCDVVSTDYVPSLLERGRARASADGLTIEFREADAESLPFADGAFDAVVSTFGVMFTPNQDQAAGELLRVCRAGGKIGLANWTPEGLIGQVFKTLGKHLPPPAGARSPALWGTRERLTDMFGAAAASISIEPRVFNFRYHSPDHFLEVLKTYYGPMLKAFAALDEAGQKDLTADLRSLFARTNKADDGTMVGAERISGGRHYQAMIGARDGSSPKPALMLGWAPIEAAQKNSDSMV